MDNEQTKPGWNTLFFTRSSLETVDMLALAQNVHTHNSKTNSKIITKLLKNGVVTNTLLQSQLALMSNCVTKGQQINRWAVLNGQQQQIWRIDLQSYCALFVLINGHKQQQKIIVSLSNWVTNPIFKVNSLFEIFKIVSMSSIEFNRRCKLELMLKQSDMKLDIHQSRQLMKTMAVRLARKQARKLILHVTKVINFGGTKRIRTLRRCFNGWIIFLYSTQLQQAEQELINGQYLIARTNMQLQSKYYQAWKILVAKLRNYD